MRLWVVPKISIDVLDKPNYVKKNCQKEEVPEEEVWLEEAQKEAICPNEALVLEYF